MRKFPRIKRVCLIALAIVCAWLVWLYCCAVPAAPQSWFENTTPPLILAHQGGEKEWPSNTIYAFDRARLAGSDVLDLDLHMTRDKVLVVIHDMTVDRTTDGTGAVAEMPWEALTKLDAAYRFTLDGSTFPLRGKGIRIPRLEEVLERFPDWRFQIEVKNAPKEIALELDRVLNAFDAKDRVLLSSFDEDMMSEIRKACPQVATSATPNEIRNLVILSRLHSESLISPDYSALQIPLHSHGLDLVTQRTVDAAHRRGVKVLPWTIDTEKEAEICRQAGADGINTNLPTKMENLRKNWKQLQAPLMSAP